MRTHSILLFASFLLISNINSYANVGDPNSSSKFVVVLDAGHGGHDPGNLGNGYKEKDISLNIVLAIGKELEKNPNIEVVYTRKTDVFVDLFVRGKIANKAKANLFVSVHCNSHNSQAYGTETFVLGIHRNQTNFEVAKKENSVIYLESDCEKNYGNFDPNSPESVMSILLAQEEYLDQSIMLASMIQNKFTNALKRKNRGVKQAGLIVLHQTIMPSVLVEVGFLTYKQEGAYLNSNKGQNDMANSITQAILDYKSSIDQNVDTNVYVKNDESHDSKPSESISGDIVYKVQIAASSKKLDPKPYNFKKLEDISRLKEGNIYKYFYGDTSDYNQVRILEQTAKNKGYSSSFVVAFKDGKKIALSEALKTTAN